MTKFTTQMSTDTYKKSLGYPTLCKAMAHSHQRIYTKAKNLHHDHNCGLTQTATFDREFTTSKTATWYQAKAVQADG